MAEDEDKLIEEQTALARIEDLDIEERRDKVLQLKLRGVPHSNIAKFLNVSTKTVQRDLAVIRERNIERVNHALPSEYMAEATAHWDEATKRLWMEYTSAEEGSIVRLKALSEIVNTQAVKMKALKDAGFIKVEQKKQVDITVNHKILEHWGDDLIDEISVKLLERGLNTDLDDPVDPSEIVDAEFEEIRREDDEDYDLD